MSKNGWTQRALEQLQRHYTDETGITDYSDAEVAVWAKDRGYTMPDPVSDVEMLTLLLQRASVRARRTDGAITYRAMLSVPVMTQGGWKPRFFDADGPSATIEKILASVTKRKQQALNILASARATLERYASAHPKHRAQTNLFDLSITNDEVEWRLRGRGVDDSDQKAG